ncbi:Down syndrome cell adhesion molecule [Amphibalanus amphitrite]|uniref:Down syndrome cell adhesion molecule n=1 Tax=Amphibalanus amphitrite TaxID=1232801 RepID=A0A6A4VCE2_AMPAM|nr:Down syndrome cell adhesion molecule [Amphibalanus amphitrite]
MPTVAVGLTPFVCAPGSGRLRTWRGRLIVEDTSVADNGTMVQCRAASSVTQQARHSRAGRLTVAEPVRRSAPRPLPNLPGVVTVAEGADAELYCLVTGHPPPIVQWLEVRGAELTPLLPSGRVEVSGQRLVMRRVRSGDAGVYRCSATSAVGSAARDTRLDAAETTGPGGQR